MKAYWGVGGWICIDLHFLDLGTTWRSVVNFTTEERATGTPWIGWVDPRADLVDVEKRKLLTLLGLEL
jgi:hypothetical protein